MILRIFKGTGVRGCLEYCAGKGADSIRLGGSVMGTTTRMIAAEFRLTRELVPRLQQAARHVVVSLDEHDRRMSVADLLLMAQQVVRGLGFERCPWVAYQHFDGHVQHVHIATCPIRYDGGRVNEWRDYLKAQKVQQELEQRWDLTLAPQIRHGDPRLPVLGRYGLGVDSYGSPKLPPSGRVKASHLTPEERVSIPAGRFSTPEATTRSLQNQEPGKRDLIKEAMESLLPRVGSLGELQLGLKDWGISLVANLEKRQLRFYLGGSKNPIYASKIDPSYSLNNLERRWMSSVQVPPVPRIQGVAPAAEAPSLPPPGRLRLDMGPARKNFAMNSSTTPSDTDRMPSPGRLDMGPARRMVVVSPHYPRGTEALVQELRRSRWQSEMEAYERSRRSTLPELRIEDPEPVLDTRLPSIALPSPGNLELQLTADVLLPRAGELVQRLGHDTRTPLPGKLGNRLTQPQVPELHHNLNQSLRSRTHR